MGDSLAAVVDSLVRHSLAVQDSAKAAAKPWYGFVQHPLFVLLWPTLLAVIGFFWVKGYEGRERAREQKEKRAAVAGEVQLFLEMAVDQLKPLVEHLATEPAIIVARAPSYARAEYPLTHLGTFEGIRPKLNDLRDPALVKEVGLWHQATSFSLQEIIDFRTMIPGQYITKYAAAIGEQSLPFRFEAIKVALQLNTDDARELAEKLKKIAGS